MTATVMHTRDGQRPHASETCYSLRCRCGPENRRQPAERSRAYAYIRAELLVSTSEVNRTKERLSAFAKTSGLELAAVFVEGDPQRPLLAFERFFQAVMRDHVPVVLLPSLLHLMVLGAPGRIREHFEAATEARVVTLDHRVACPAREAVS
ncbi:hypothetical protein ACFV9C_29805 [Kribbella sp. NPDC059898]|uniref:hypothetical protein n=1 Tax=Kribbella sp. NPDC059898 TaxID=3346995 RepID=UPI0036488C71